MRILFISPYLPSLVRVRPFNIIHALARRGHDVSLLALRPPGDGSDGLTDLQNWCRLVQVVPLPRWRPLWNALRALPVPALPLQAAYSRSPLMTQAIRRALDEEHYDVIHLEHLRGAELAYALHASDPPLVFDSVDSISLLFERAKKHAPRWQSRLMAWLDLGRTRRYEAQFARRFAHILVTSPEDREALAALTGDSQPLVVLPNGVDLDYFAPLGKPRQPDTVVFSGKMSYHANTAAALDLVQKVMPGVWAERPETLVWLAGKDPPQVLRALAQDQRVIVTGTVPDLRPYLGRASVAVTPLRYGVGIQNKVLEAMAMATPVVTTPPTCRALQAEPGQHLLVGESAPGLAQAILSLLADDERREQLGQAGRRYIEEHHDWERIAVQLEAVYQEAIARN